MSTAEQKFTAEQELGYKAGLVRFHQGNKVVGAGFYINHGYVLTCAHVITQCLSLGTKPQGVAVDVVAGKLIKVDFPFVAKEQFQNAEVLPDLWKLNDQDLAVLKILEAIPDRVSPLPFPESDYYREHRYHVYGFPDGHSDGIWAKGEFLGERTNGWIQMEDTKAEGLAIEPGFSGAPVWDEALGAIAGMTVARDKDREDAKVGFMIPYLKLKPALDAIALFGLLLPEAAKLESHWQRAYRLVRPEISTEPYPKTFQEAILQVQNMTEQGSSYRAIAQFIGYLALPELGLLIQPRLFQWLEKQVADANALLEAVRQKKGIQQAQQATGLAPHLLFWVQAELNSDRYFAQAYLIPNREHYNPAAWTGVKQLKDLAQRFAAEEDEKVSQSELENVLQDALNESVRELTQEQDDLPAMQVEVFLSRRCLRWQVDQWSADQKTIFNPRPESVGSRYRVVLRLVERLDERQCTPQMRVLWKRKWSVLEKIQDEKMQHSPAADRLICGDNKEPGCLFGELSPNRVMGWHRLQPPQPVSENDPCPFSVLVGTGASVALWLHQPVPNSEQEYSQLLGYCLSELPARVTRLRKEAHDRQDQSNPHMGENIGLIWEDPKLVPPGAIQPPRLRMSA
ncbi:MAG: trypsin-like peptidase domain-containing protein [Cyanobacteria bacterium CRU_2_1]|nr:trypsin-like peptidase domain-containing protein [Cyanobacteria bacterium RU_5_0]NJR58064.1 trypsin-like peptidase domain-containing protein [Cyanobacteria bacterium CRU_2_1]